MTQASPSYSNPETAANGGAEPLAIATPQVDILPSSPVNVTDRPEAVVLLVFASLVMLWQLYLDLLEDDDGSLSSGKLAQRLGVSYSTVRRRRLREDFTQWSRSLDPDEIGWMYVSGRFTPVG